MKLDINDVIDIMRAKVELSSDEMYKRRGQTIISWVKWMNVMLKDAPSLDNSISALEEIAMKLENSGCSEDDTNHLFANFLEQEAYDYVEAMNAFKENK